MGQRFGGDHSVLGRKLVVDARPREIVGVMPAGFRINDVPFAVILPAQLNRSQAILAGFGLNAIGRLKPGVSLQQANADIERLIPIWMRSWPSIQNGKSSDTRAISVYESWRITPNLVSLRDAVVGNVGDVLWIVMGTLGLTGLAHLVIGSVAEKVLRDAPCSVLVVKMPKGAPRPARPDDALLASR